MKLGLGEMTANRKFFAVACGVVGPVTGWVLATDRIADAARSLWLTWVLLVCFFALVSLPFIRARRQRKSDYFEPIFLVSLLFGLYFGLRTIYIFWQPELIAHSEVFDIPLLNRSLFYLVLGFLGLLVAYYSPLAVKLARSLSLSGLKKEWPAGGLLGKIVVLYSVGLAARWLGIETGISDLMRLPHDHPLVTYAEVHSAGRDYLANFQEYTKHALLALMLSAAYRRSKGATAWLVVLLGLEMFFVLPATSKRTFLVLALMVGLWSNYRRRLIVPNRYIALGLVAMFLIFPWVNTYRAAYSSGQPYAELSRAIPAAGREAWRQLSGMGPKEYMRYSVNTFFGRAHGIDSMCLAVKYTPSAHDYLWGRDYLYIIPTGLIPRAVWKSKPFFESEEIFELYYWREDVGWSVGGSPGPTMIGDFYMNFSLPGVLAGMFALGLIYRFLYQFFVAETGASSPGLLFYFVSLLPLLQIEGSILNLSLVLKKLIYLTIFHLVLSFRQGGS